MPSKKKSSKTPPPAPSTTTSTPPSPSPAPDKNQLFIVAPHIDTETLLANASEDLQSISTIAADLADDVDDSRRSIALAISRMADGVQLLVERALDDLETRETVQNA